MGLLKLSYERRRYILFAVTSFVLAYVRSFLQYKRYFWESFGQFLISWLIHAIFLMILIGIAYAIINAKVKYFIDDIDERREYSVSEIMVIVLVIVLIAAIAIFFFAQIAPINTPDEFE